MSELYNAQLSRHLQKIEESLPAYLPDLSDARSVVTRAMAYACEAGGKRLRPVLTLEFCRLAGGEPDKALPFAAAVECIHSYSLVHDDLPCMDNSPLRRGKPSVHAAFGEDMALLAGDALLNAAFEIMLCEQNRAGIPDDRVLAAAAALARQAGVLGMVGGQALDLYSEGRTITLAELEALQRGKTAALLIAACEMGCHIGGGDAVMLAAARTFGLHLGLCFQIVDDILDVTSTAEKLGKPTGSDDENGKTTYVSLLGLEEARRLAAERTQKAVEALTPFGDDADGLRALARALLTRDR